VSRIASLVGSDAEVEPMLSPVPDEVAVGEEATLEAVLGDERELIDPAAERDGVAFDPSVRALRRVGSRTASASGSGGPPPRREGA
jgi:hypothetical protein